MTLKNNFIDKDILEFKDLINNTVEHIHKRAILPEGELSISFIDDENMQQLNKEYRNKDASTDVLTFPLYEEDILGDIYISINQVKVKAKKGSIEIKDQLVMTIAHAFAHLNGYTHEEFDQRKIMEDYEDFLLKRYI